MGHMLIFGHAFLAITQPFLGQLGWIFYWSSGDYNLWLSTGNEKSKLWCLFLGHFWWLNAVTTTRAPNGLVLRNPTKKLRPTGPGSTGNEKSKLWWWFFIFRPLLVGKWCDHQACPIVLVLRKPTKKLAHRARLSDDVPPAPRAEEIHRMSRSGWIFWANQYLEIMFLEFTWVKPPPLNIW